MPRRRALAARAAAACRPGSMSTPSRCSAANARWVEMPSRRAISDAEIGSARYIAAICASETAGPAGGRVPRQTRRGEPLGHRLRVHPVPGGQLAPGEPLLLAEAPELGGRRRRFAHPARAAGTEPATARSDRDVVLQQPGPHQMRRRVQPLRDRGDRQTRRPRTAAAAGRWWAAAPGSARPWAGSSTTRTAASARPRRTTAARCHR